MYVHLAVLPVAEGVAAADLGRSQPWSPEQSGSRSPAACHVGHSKSLGGSR